MEIDTNLEKSMSEMLQSYLIGKTPFQLPPQILNYAINQQDFSKDELKDLDNSEIFLDAQNELSDQYKSAFAKNKRLIKDIKILLQGHDTLINVLSSDLLPLFGILWVTNNAFNSNRYSRKLLLNLPTNDKAKEQAALEAKAYLNISDEQFENIKQNAKTIINYDSIHEILAINKILGFALKYKYFIDYLFYVSSREIFRQHIDNYWKLYIDFLKLTEKHLGHLFIKRFDDLTFANKIDIQKKINYYQKFLDGLTP